VRVGVFGGSFDPPHVGHLLTAGDAAEALALDRLLLVPAARQPLKDGGGATPAQRLEMTRLLAGDDRRFAVDPIEIERGGLSFTVDTLAALGARWPQAELVLLVGADVLASFHLWREPARVRTLATLAVLTRAAGDEGAGGRVPEGSPALDPPPVLVATRRVDVSSTEIRARVRAGQSIRGFVPEAVADYIRSAGLYR
jgi:nicotinate-nucleotide adenylyltransferase